MSTSNVSSLRLLVSIAFALLVGILLGGCGSKSSADISVVLSDNGKSQTVTFACKGSDCKKDSQAKLVKLLLTKEDTNRVCTEIYGGSQTAVVTGAINDKNVSKTFTRSNGCAIADYDSLMSAIGQKPVPSNKPLELK